MASVKGSVMLTSKKLAIETHGEEGFNKALTALSKEDREIFSGIINASKWYPLETYVNWLEASKKILSNDSESIFIKERIQLGVERQFRGIYKAILHLGSPENVLKRLAGINCSYFDGITVDVTIIGKGEVLLTYKGFEKRHRLFELVLKGWWQKILELMKARNINIEIKTSLTENKGYSEILMRWEK